MAIVVNTPCVQGRPGPRGPQGNDGAPGENGDVFTAVRGSDALRDKSFHEHDQMHYLLYLTTEGDGGTGWVSFDEDSMEADDGINVWRPNNISVGDPGRWIRRSG